jgi:hypothetical protein
MRVDMESLREQAERAAADLRQQRTQRLGQESVTWLALPPQWTGRLAEACGFPAPKPLRPWVEDAVAAGLCQRQALFGDFGDDFGLDGEEEPDVRFWMPDTERSQVLGDFRSRTTLRRLAAEIGTRINAAPASIERDTGLDRWADLAIRGLSDSRIGIGLTATVSACVSSGRMAEALDWVYAAEALAPVLGEEITSAAARAKRLINLEYRHRADARFVEHFVPRDEQRAEIERLLSSGPGEPWALHFVGMGGIGKTMFIRYLSGAFTAAGGPDIVTTRVDFDHISPRYPAEQPGQLLRELAGGLTGHLVEGDQVSAYTRFVECADVLDRVTVTSPGLGGFTSTEFANTLDAFADLIRSIAKPVVLILDTCEELAKLHPAGEPVPSVERTFEILERLHAKVTGMRAILAGRRLLAAEYANWGPSASGLPPAWAVSLATRRYLRLFEVRGFAEKDARQFLSRVRKHERPMPPDIEDAILRASPDSGRVADLMIADGPDAASAVPEQLYNPYELNLYADWFETSAGTLTAAEIESGDLDGYLESRIISRLPADPPVGSVLPAIAALGRLDVNLVRIALAAPEAVADRGFRTLADQEWIVTRAAEESGVTVLEVQPGLLRRLRAYFGRPERAAASHLVRETLSREIPPLLRRRPLDAAAVEHLAAGMRILPDTAALALWDELTERIARDREWTWAESACARLLANDSDADPPSPALEAAVRAVYIGALRRGNPAYDVTQEWEFVAAVAARHPDQAAGAALADRAAFGTAAARSRRGDPVTPLADDAAFTRAWLRTQAAPGHRERLAAAFAAVEALLDAGADEISGTLPPVDEVRGLAVASELLGDPQLTAFADLLLARSEMRAGLGTEQFEAAAQLAPAASTGPPPVDWPLPRLAQARVRLSWLHATVGASQLAPSADRIQRWLDEALGHDDIEHERLASAALLRLLGRAPVDADRVRALDQVARTMPPAAPLCPAHVETPPLAASVVRAWVALGEPDAARTLIEAWEEFSPAVERDAATTAQVRLATVYLVRRMRWRGLRDSLVLTLATSGSPEQALAARATQVLLGRDTEIQAVIGASAAALIDGTNLVDEEGLRTVDIAWRTALPANAPGAAAVLKTIRPIIAGATAAPVLAAHVELDQREARVLRGRLVRSLLLPSPLSSRSSQSGQRAEEADDWLRHRLTTGAGSPADAAELRAIRLREWAMSDREWSAQTETPHDLAEAALEEGELLALRLPYEGRRLLNLAVLLFDESGDLMAATQAAIRKVIALYHSATPSSAQVALRELEPRYDRLRAMSASPLPGWNELVAWSRAHIDDDPVGGAWDGWLVRLAACIDPESVERPEAAELVLSPAPGRLALSKRYRGLQSRAVTAVLNNALGAGLCIALGAWGGRTALSALGWHPNLVVGLTLGLAAAFVAFVTFVLVVAFSVALLGPPTMKLIGAQLRLQATMDPVLSAGSLDLASVSVRITGVRGKLNALYYFPRSVSVGVTGFAIHLTRRGATADLPLQPDPLRTSLPPKLVRALRYARTLHADELMLRVGPKAVPGAWEAVIGLNQVTKADDDIGRYFRGLRAYPARKPRLATASVSRVMALCPRPFALFAEESWEAGGIVPQLLHSGEKLRRLEQGADTEVMHLIGTPVLSELGPVLTLDGSAATTLQPDRLPVSNPFLIIVQAEPTRSTVSVDPRSGILRVVAHDIAEASAGASVLMIPALPGHVAVDVMQEVARALAAGPLDRKALLALAQRLRVIVFTAGDPRAAVAARALPAFDICLYVGE